MKIMKNNYQIKQYFVYINNKNKHILKINILMKLLGINAFLMIFMICFKKIIKYNNKFKMWYLIINHESLHIF